MELNYRLVKEQIKYQISKEYYDALKHAISVSQFIHALALTLDFATILGAFVYYFEKSQKALDSILLFVFMLVARILSYFMFRYVQEGTLIKELLITTGLLFVCMSYVSYAYGIYGFLINVYMLSTSGMAVRFQKKNLQRLTYFFCVIDDVSNLELDDACIDKAFNENVLITLPNTGVGIVFTFQNKDEAEGDIVI